MSGILVVVEHLRGEVRDITRELITAGAGLGPVTVAVIAADPPALRAAVDVEGVTEIAEVRVTAGSFESDVYEHAVEQLITEREPELVLLGFTVNSMSFGPSLAARLGLGFASDVFGIERSDGQLLARRAAYGGKVHAELELPVPALLMLRAGTWPPADGSGGATVSVHESGPVSSRARHREFADVPAADVDITTADFLVAIGRGIESKDNVGYFEDLAGRMSATLVASRPLVDAGWLPAARQVGQSGKTVKPKVYLALGISGAVQHLAGMKGAGTVIAVNTDPDAAIFGVARFGAVADLFEVAQELEKLL